MEGRGRVMINPADLEKIYQNYIHHLSDYIPDGIVPVNEEIIMNFGIDVAKSDLAPSNLEPYCYFYVIESPDKITLINDEFIVWIVPTLKQMDPLTYTLIARNNENEPELELAFTTQGPYNSPNTVLRILEGFLMEIKENEKLITKLDHEEE